MIGYYVHHEGRGHLVRAMAVTAQARMPVTGLSSLARPAGWSGDWIDLPRDDDGTPRGPTRDGVWHWAPRGHEGFGARMTTIARWITTARPAVLVSDVSVEVLVLAALLGVPTAAVLLHGDRRDAPHRSGLGSADVVVAPWPAAHRRPWHDDLGPRLVTTGGFGRYDGRTPPGPPERPSVLVLAGRGGHDISAPDVAAAARATPGWRWSVVGILCGQTPGPVIWRPPTADIWTHLGRATVVVATAGNGVVAEIAAARRPALLLPQQRPFGEQAALAQEVARLCPVRVEDAWPRPGEWPGILDGLAGLDPSGWARHVDGRGARRFATAVEAVAA